MAAEFLSARRRKVIVHIATSADGYIARSDGDLAWLTSRPAPKGFYGMSAFMRSVDTKLLGRKTYEGSLRMGAKFDSHSRSVVFSRHPPPHATLMARCSLPSTTAVQELDCQSWTQTTLWSNFA